MLGKPELKKNPKPLQTRWADQYYAKNAGPFGQTSARKKKSETPPDLLGRPVLEKNRNPSRPVGQTSTKPKPPKPLGRPVLEKKSETFPDLLGRPVLEKNAKPFQTRWADQYQAKNAGPFGQTSTRKNDPARIRWANQYLKKPDRASIKRAQTQAAIAGALLAYRTGPDQDVFTTNQITSALVAYRSAADQDMATTSSIAAALLSYYTVAQVDGLLAGKLGVTAHTVGAVSVDGYTLTLAANPWNIVRTYNLTPGRELLFACRYRLGTASNFVVYMSEADNVYDPLYGSFVAHLHADAGETLLLRLPVQAGHGLQLGDVRQRGRQRLRGRLTF